MEPKTAEDLQVLASEAEEHIRLARAALNKIWDATCQDPPIPDVPHPALLNAGRWIGLLSRLNDYPIEFADEGAG